LHAWISVGIYKDIVIIMVVCVTTAMPRQQNKDAHKHYTDVDGDIQPRPRRIYHRWRRRVALIVFE